MARRLAFFAIPLVGVTAASAIAEDDKYIAAATETKSVTLPSKSIEPLQRALLRACISCADLYSPLRRISFFSL